MTVETWKGNVIPRDIDTEYKTTRHFMERLKYRTAPKPSKEIVFETVEGGIIKTTHVSGRFIFEQEIDDITWWVLVEMNREAFDNEKKYHSLISIYAPNQHKGKHQTVFEVSV